MLIILDRDGVINAYSGEYICSPEAWVAQPGSIEAIARLSRAGHTLAVATNQSGVGRGYYSEAILARMHDKMCSLAHAAGGHIACITWCPHLPDAGCDCRKPLPGLLHRIQAQLKLPSLQGSLMVGDSRCDLEAALSAGVQPILVRTGNGLATEAELRRDPLAVDIPVYADLATFTQAFLAQENPPQH